MRLTLSRAALLPALVRVQAAARTTVNIPVLKHLLLSAENDTLTVSGTDMELAVRTAAPAVVTMPGSCTIHAETFRTLVERLPADASIELHHDGDRVSVKAGRSSARLPSLDVADFPVLVSGALPHVFTVPGAALKRLIGRCRFAIARDATRSYLNGLYLHVADSEGVKVLRAVATDGAALARTEEPLPEGAQGMPGVIVPTNVLTELYRALGEDDVAVAVSETRISFTVGATTFLSKLIDGKFPEYERVIPRGNANVLTVDKDAFQNAIELAASVSNVIRIEVSEAEAAFSSTDPDAGEMRTVIGQDAMEYTGEAMEVGFNVKFPRPIAALCGDRLELAMSDPATPVMARDPAVPEAVYVIMPYRI